MNYSLEMTVDLLDKIAGGATPSQVELVRGAIALALHAQAGSDEGDVLGILEDLEGLALGHIATIDDQVRSRAAALAKVLRRAVGVH